MIPANIELALKNASIRTRIPVEVLRSVAQEESNFNPKVTSKAGAMGLMQLMPETAKSYNVTDPFDPTQNALAGAKLLTALFKIHKGHWPKVLASYNWGVGNVKKHPSYELWPAETRKYVNDIMNRAKQYFALWV